MLTPVGRKIVCLLKEERKKTILDYVWERFVKGWGLTTAHRLPIAERERREKRICQILSNFSPVAFRRRRERLRHHLRFGRRRPTSADSPSQTPDSGRRHHHQRVGHGIVRNGEGDYGPISSLARSSGIDSDFQCAASARRRRRRRRFASAKRCLRRGTNQQMTLRHLKQESKSDRRKRSRPSIPTRPAAG